jgi:hypothetical protein
MWTWTRRLALAALVTAVGVAGTGAAVLPVFLPVLALVCVTRLAG